MAKRKLKKFDTGGKNNTTSSNNINSFHYDCDENEKNINNKQFKPLLSCVNYFNDNDFPLFKLLKEKVLYFYDVEQN